MMNKRKGASGISSLSSKSKQQRGSLEVIDLTAPPVDSTTKHLIEFKGGVKGAKGYGGCGYVLYELSSSGCSKSCVLSGYRYLGEGLTTNQADYLALLEGLKAAKDGEEAVKDVIVVGDNSVVINQVTYFLCSKIPRGTRKTRSVLNLTRLTMHKPQVLGKFKCKDQKLVPLRRSCSEMLQQFEKFEVRWVGKESNKRAAGLKLKAIESGGCKVLREGGGSRALDKSTTSSLSPMLEQSTLKDDGATSDAMEEMEEEDKNEGEPSQVQAALPSVAGIENCTPQQSAIVREAASPNLQRGIVVRCSAAAGTGKTTTLMNVVVELVSKGHRKIKYVTFNKSAAADAERRFKSSDIIQRVNADICCSTTHSAAFKTWSDNNSRMELGNPKSDQDLDKLIDRTLGNDIDRFLHPLRASNRHNLNAVRKTVIYFIRKQLTVYFMFLSAPVSSSFNRTYYPAVKYHDDDVREFIPDCGDFYVNGAKKMWSLLDLSRNGGSFFTFDSVLRNVQLKEYEIDCTALLVDEAQDLTACQMDWFILQAAKYKKQGTSFKLCSFILFCFVLLSSAV